MGFEQRLKRLALTGGDTWLRALGAAVACVLVATLFRLLATPLLGSLAGSTIFVPAVVIAGLWAGRRGAYLTVVLGACLIWAVAWAHPDPMDMRAMLIGTSLFKIVGVITAEVSAALRRAMRAEAAALAELKSGQDRLRLAHDAGQLGTWEWDIASDTLRLSEGYLRNWRVLKRSEMPFLEVASRVHPDDQAAILESRRRVLEDGEPYRSQYRVIGDDGQVRWYAGRGEPVHDAQGRIVQVHGVNRDITEQMQVENVLRESEVRFRTMANSAPSPVWVTRPEGGVEFVNEAYCDFFGLRPQDLLGDVWAGLIHPDDQQPILELSLRERQTGLPYEFDCRFRNADGEYRWIHARCRPRERVDGAFMGYIGIAFDITETRAAEGALRAQERRQRFLLQLGDGLRESEDPAAIAAFAESSLGQFLRANRVGYAEVDEASDTVTVDGCYADGVLEPLRGTWSLATFGPTLLAEVQRGRTVAIADIREDPRTAALAETFARAGIVANLAVPVFRTGKPRAVLFVHDHAPRAWTPDEIALVEEAAGRTWTEIERVRALAEVRESEARFRSISDSAPILVWVTNADRSRAFVNKTYVEFIGGTYEDALTGDWRGFLHPEDWDRIVQEQVAGESSLKPFSLEARYRRNDGTFRWLRSFSRPRLGRDNQLLGFVGAAYDVTEERQVQADLEHINELLAERVAHAMAEKEHAEAALVRAQKLEALGRLTGGVAHDFNNLLTVVVGALDMILKHPDDVDKRTRMAEAAMAAARRGEQLTHQLLAFSRRQPLRPALSDINALILENEPLIRRATGEAIEFVSDLCDGEAVARVDPAQFEAALFNLVVNARDATRDGGRITLATRRRAFDEGEIAEIPAGDYVIVRVSDTGAGMEPEVLARVFEPFFTTKPQGKGTGLGLSQVYGFAQQSGGGVSIDSTPGDGAVVTLYLPASAECIPVAATDPLAHRPLGSLKVLLVEDDAAVAGVAEVMLRHLGHEVTRVSSAARALAKLRAKTAFDLLLSDVVMPGVINGVDLAHRASEMRPGLKIVLTSGYAGEALDDTLASEPWPFLRKPYSQQDLAEVLRTAAAPAAPKAARVRARRPAAKRPPAKRKAVAET